MTDTPIDTGQLDIREKLAHIDQMLADIDRSRAQTTRTWQETRFAPWLAIISGMTAGAALFAAGVAFVKLLGP